MSLVPADNLASLLIGGYKALNAALRKCRHCLAVKETMESQVKRNCVYTCHHVLFSCSVCCGGISA